jgi:ribosomal protein S18 acetylase RimI-like enzyme
MLEKRIEILPLPKTIPLGVLSQMGDIHAEAFSGPPYYETLGDALTFSGRLPFHIQRRGFKAHIAVDGTAPERILGYAYGYDSQPDNWWRMQVSSKMTPEMAADWLENCFELVELAVLPAFQGKSLGARLHDSLLTGLAHRTAVLSTAQKETPALRLYRKRGWETLLDQFTFSGAAVTFLIMGLRMQK